MAAAQPTRTFTDEEGKGDDSYTEEEIFQEYDPNAAAFHRAATAYGLLTDPASRTRVPGRNDLLLPLDMRQYYIEYVNGLTSGTRPTGGIWTTDEGQKMLAYWDGPEGQARLNSVNAPDTMLKPLTEMITAYSDVSTAACLKRHYGSVRGYFEGSTPVTQCANTVKKVNTSSQCWICMTPINPPQQITNQFRGLELSPECEHIFPVAQALCFTGLYETQLFNELAEADEAADGGANPTQSRADAYVRGVTLEYQWSHRICNQVKNDSHFITYDPKIGFAIKKDPITAFLTKLKTTDSYGGGPTFVRYLKAVTGKTIEDWENRIRDNIYNVSNTLLTYAQRSKLTPEQHSRVTLMSIRSFIALSPECGGASEPPVPDNVLKRGRKALPSLNMDEPLAAANQGIVIASEHIVGYINEILGTMGRNSGISARVRADVTAKLLDLGLALRDDFTGQTTYGLASDLRFKVLYYLKNQAGASWEQKDPRDIWSDFQSWTNQIIIGRIYEKMAELSVDLLRGEGGDFVILANKLNEAVSVSRPMVGVAPTPSVVDPRVPLEQVPKRMSLLMSYVDKNIIQIIRRGGVPYEAVLATPPIDPNPNQKNPGWFESDQVAQNGQSGGGDAERYAAFWSSKETVGGLRKRRSLY
jgi:hypothetical protein